MASGQFSHVIGDPSQRAPECPVKHRWQQRRQRGRRLALQRSQRVYFRLQCVQLGDDAALLEGGEWYRRLRQAAPQHRSEDKDEGACAAG